ncbi:MAG: hypothetical protein QOH60_2087 [Mycobacterium sp.]|nr:hypothetical protein [Mycobacterium sp.]
MAVPIDYDNPDNGVATLAVIRIRATGAKTGSLVVNPGGPGGSGVEAAAAIVRDLTAPVREHFDFVGFDPRGVGYSRPAVRCLTDAEIDRYHADPVLDYVPDGLPGVDYSPGGVAKNEAALMGVVQRCVDTTGKDFLAHVGTADVVKDLDALRAALGDDKLSYIGFSYGTLIGGLYAEAYPNRVRAMVLDGVMDPSVEPIDRWLGQATAIQVAFNDYAADCARSTDCPLGTDPAKAVEVYRSLVDPLTKQPARAKDPRGVSYFNALIATVSAMYSPAAWDQLTKGLTALTRGDQADDLLVLADELTGRGDDGHYSNLQDAFTAVECRDEAFPKDPESWVEANKRLRDAAPFQTAGEFTGSAPRGICAFWPVGATQQPKRYSAPGVAPVLVVSTTHDPSTPYQEGVSVAEQLGGSLLTVEATQHTAAFYGHACVDDIVTAYLVDLVLPPPGARCVSETE